MQISETGKRNKVAGFSLLELLIVLCILSVMTGLLAPRIVVNLQGKAPTMLALEKVLQETRTRALVTGKMHSIVVDIKEGRFVATKKESLNDAKSLTQSTKAQLLPSGVSFTGIIQHGEPLERLEYAQIQVRPDGLTEPVRIRLHSKENNKECTLRIEPSTAKLVLIDGEPL